MMSVAVVPAAVPEIITYQGRVNVGGQPFTGTGLFRFAIRAPSPLFPTVWTHDGSVGDANGMPASDLSLAVTQGIFTVRLGDTNLGMSPLPPGLLVNHARPVLRIWFDDGVNGRAQLTPDQPLTAAPYALVSGTVTAGGVTSASLANGAVTAGKISAGAIAGSNLLAGTITSNQIAGGTVHRMHLATGAIASAQLIRPYDSGFILDNQQPLGFSATVYDVPFNVTFTSPPAVSLLLQSPNNGFQARTIPRLLSRSTTNFTVELQATNRGGGTLVPLTGTNTPALLSPARIFGAPALAFSVGAICIATQTITCTTNTFTETYIARCCSSVPVFDGQGNFTGFTNDCYPPYPFPFPACPAGGAEYEEREVTEVDCQGTGQYVTNCTSGALFYSRAAGSSGNGWTTRTIVTTGSPLDPSLATISLLNGLAKPSIAFHSANDGRLRWVEADDSTGNSWNSSRIVAPSGRYPSLQEVNNRPAISFYDPVNTSLKYIRAQAIGQIMSWDTNDTVQVGSIDDVGRYSVLRVVSGRPAIAFYRATAGTGRLEFVRATDTDGATWGSAVVVATVGLVHQVLGMQNGGCVSMEIVNGRPAMAFANPNAAGISYVRANTSTGSSWPGATTLGSIGLGGGGQVHLSVGNGFPMVIFNEGQRLFFTIARDVNGDDWSSPVQLDSAPTASNPVPGGIYVANSRIKVTYGLKTAADQFRIQVIGNTSPQFTVNWTAIQP